MMLKIVDVETILEDLGNRDLSTVQFIHGNSVHKIKEYL